MKQTVLFVVFLLAIGMLVAVPVLAHFSRPWSDCSGKVVTFTGPRGEPVECVCFPGTLATCFDPGP
jgi:hypothetical protein